MNWEALTAIGELAGSAVVLVTLVFVAVQVRDAKRLLAESASMYRFNAGRETTFKAMEVAPAYVKMYEHLRGPASSLAVGAQRFGLDAAEYLQLRQLASYIITNHERNWRSPISALERQQVLENAARMVTRDPIGKELWQASFRQRLPRDFVQDVEAAIERLNPNSSEESDPGA